MTPPEQCDNGTANNTGGYNKCTTDCKLGPYCGDVMVTDGEQLRQRDERRLVRRDDRLRPRLQAARPLRRPDRADGVRRAVRRRHEQRRLRRLHQTSASAARYCGDGKVQSPQEQCDDGANDGTYGNCGDPTMPLPNCQFGPRCGDGDRAGRSTASSASRRASNDPNCTAACRKPGVCGDGVPTPPEQCDYGAVDNNGEYGGCAPGCILAPHCGDGVKNGPEDCDDGVNDNSYGGCSPQCKLAPHCGDGMANPPYEQCDDGVNNGPTGKCSTVCKFNIL